MLVRIVLVKRLYASGDKSPKKFIMTMEYNTQSKTRNEFTN